MQTEGTKFKYFLNNKEVKKEDFKSAYKAGQEVVIDGYNVSSTVREDSPFFLDEAYSFSPQNKDKTEKELLTILREKLKSFGMVPIDIEEKGTVFEKLQDTPMEANMASSIRRGKIIPYDKVGDLNYENPNAIWNSDKKAKKETEGKLFYELDFKFIKQMAERMQSNKDNSKYEMWNWQKPMTPRGIEDLKQAMWRHVIAVMQGEFEDDGREFGHLEAISNNAMMINYQLKNR
jgi:hypothetical protein